MMMGLGALLFGVASARQLAGRSLWVFFLLAPGLSIAAGLAGWLLAMKLRPGAQVHGGTEMVGALLGLAGLLLLVRGPAGLPACDSGRGFACSPGADRRGGAGSPGSVREGRRLSALRGWELFPLLILALAAWLYPVGAGQLEPDPRFMVEVAPWAAAGGGEVHPLGPAAMPGDPLAPLLIRIGGDPFLLDRALAGAFQVLALLVLYGSLRSAIGHWMGAFLGAGFVYSWGAPGWLLTTTAAAAGSHLLLAAGLGSRAMSASVFARLQASLLVGAAGMLNSGAAVVGLLGLGLLEVVRGADRRWAVPPVLLAGILAGPLQPGLPPATLWVIALPVVGWWGRREDPVALLTLCEPLSWIFGGSLAPGTAAAGAAGLLAGGWIGRRWQEASPRRPTLKLRPAVSFWLPWRYLLAALGIGLVVLGTEPGESEFNHRLLLPAQKKKIDLLELAAARPLSDWVRLMGASLELAPDDLELARFLAQNQGTAVILTPGEAVEPVEVAGTIAALAGGRPIAGWHADAGLPELFPAPQLIRRTRDLELAEPAGIRYLVLRGSPDLEVPAEASVALTTPGGSRILEFSAAAAAAIPWHSSSGLAGEPLGAVAPGHLTEFSVPLPGQPPDAGQPGLLVDAGEPAHVTDRQPAYTVSRNGEPWGAELPVHDSRFILPETPGTYRLRWRQLESAEMVSDLPAALASLRVSVVELPHKVASRSFVPLRVRWVHRGPGAIDLGRFRGARLQACIPHGSPGEVSFPAPIQPLPSAVLEPGQPLELELTLSTPEPEGDVPVSLELVDLRGAAHPVAWETPLSVSTWRRLPPVGSW
ncbi:MAG: hypothetical protein HY319_06510 [Armatimonadetes bacterium]|nr:hypothetical protein [Armatimonadota bacterium]